jgi:hypothetical protein
MATRARDLRYDRESPALRRTTRAGRRAARIVHADRHGERKPMRDATHVREIDRVLQGEATGRDAIVATSWRRCVETYGLDPARPDPRPYRP